MSIEHEVGNFLALLEIYLDDLEDDLAELAYGDRVVGVCFEDMLIAARVMIKKNARLLEALEE